MKGLIVTKTPDTVYSLFLYHKCILQTHNQITKAIFKTKLRMKLQQLK